jgi:hypothetical protein
LEEGGVIDGWIFRIAGEGEVARVGAWEMIW